LRISMRRMTHPALDQPPGLPDGAGPAAGWRGRVLERSLRRAAERSLERSMMFVDAARSLIAERGSAGFTIQQAAERAGQSLRVFYQHFESKDDVILAVYEEQVNSQIAAAKAHMEQFTDPLDRLAALIIGDSDLPARKPTPLETALAHFRFKLLQTNPDAVLVIEEQYVTLMRDTVRQAADAGRLDGCDPDVGGYFVASVKNEFYFGGFLLRKQRSLPAPSLLDLARFCLRGLGADLPPSFR
jgi:AcrR family transcriptional regulator